MSHDEPIPEGHVVVRFKVEGRIFEVAIPEEQRDEIIQRLGEKGASVLMSGGGFDIDAWHRDVVGLAEQLPEDESLKRVEGLVAGVGRAKDALSRSLGALDELADLVGVPRLNHFQEPLAHSRPTPQTGPSAKELAKRKAKKKAADKARKKNRGK